VGAGMAAPEKRESRARIVRKANHPALAPEVSTELCMDCSSYSPHIIRYVIFHLK